MKFYTLAALYLGFAAIGYSAEPKTSPPDAPTSQPAAIEGTEPKRLSLNQRLSSQFMEAFDADRRALAERVQPIDVPYTFNRGTFHFHSRLSHDSIGTIEEIVQAAKATGTKIIGFTEHPSRSVDVVKENIKGWHEGIYFLAGTESNYQLHWPGREGEDELRFVCHPEDVPTFDLTIYDGIEIYNTHSDVKDEPTSAVITAMLLNLAAVKKHPEAAFCSFLDYPEDFLARFDRLSASTQFSGIAANDSHQNQRLKIEAHPDGTVIAYDGAGQEVLKTEGFKAGLVMAALGQTKRPTEKKILADVQLDPYETSMRHVGTFLQLKDGQDINEHSVREALRTGRVVLGFELIAPLPAVGFWVDHAGSPVGTVGDTIAWQDGLSLQVKLPLSAEIRIIRNGQLFREANADSLEIDSLPKGVYRLEAFQRLAGQRYPWVLSNPIKVTEKR
ncbi:MAG: hypothetical protein GXP26_07765 [Planctomycetes bacterium]|nr:hypothetical protein [Planctomycetota bacterium]